MMEPTETFDDNKKIFAAEPNVSVSNIYENDYIENNDPVDISSVKINEDLLTQTDTDNIIFDMPPLVSSADSSFIYDNVQFDQMPPLERANSPSAESATDTESKPSGNTNPPTPLNSIADSYTNLDEAFKNLVIRESLEKYKSLSTTSSVKSVLSDFRTYHSDEEKVNISTHEHTPSSKHVHFSESNFLVKSCPSEQDIEISSKAADELHFFHGEKENYTRHLIIDLPDSPPQPVPDLRFSPNSQVHSLTSDKNGNHSAQDDLTSSDLKISEPFDPSISDKVDNVKDEVKSPLPNNLIPAKTESESSNNSVFPISIDAAPSGDELVGNFSDEAILSVWNTSVSSLRNPIELPTIDELSHEESPALQSSCLTPTSSFITNSSEVLNESNSNKPPFSSHFDSLTFQSSDPPITITDSSNANIEEPLNSLMPLDIEDKPRESDLFSNGLLIKRTILLGPQSSPLVTKGDIVTLQLNCLNTQTKEQIFDQIIEFIAGDAEVPVALDVCIQTMFPGEYAILESHPKYIYDNFIWDLGFCRIPSGTFLTFHIKVISAESFPNYSQENTDRILAICHNKKVLGDRFYAIENLDSAALCYESALRHLNAIRHDKQLTITILNNLAYIFMRKTEYNPAIDTLNELLQIDPKNAKGLLRMGKCFEEKGNLENALKYYRSANQISASNTILSMINVVQCKLKEHDAATSKMYRNIFVTEKASSLTSSSENVLLTADDKTSDSTSSGFWTYAGYGIMFACGAALIYNGLRYLK